jgi:hypothetical protein
MTRRHWAPKQLVIDPTRCYGENDLYHLKPCGLWYEIDGAWEKWCRAESFGLERYLVPTEVEVDVDRILVLDTEDQMQRFLRYVRRVRYSEYIQWDALVTRYAGIEIPDFWAFGQHRLEPGYTWLYAWDASSGCVWDLSAIRVVERQERVA